MVRFALLLTLLVACSPAQPQPTSPSPTSSATPPPDSSTAPTPASTPSTASSTPPASVEPDAHGECPDGYEKIGQKCLKKKGLMPLD